MNINLFFDKIFYINLDKDTDRNVKIVEQFKRYDISNFERKITIGYNIIGFNNVW